MPENKVRVSLTERTICTENPAQFTNIEKLLQPLIIFKSYKNRCALNQALNLQQKEKTQKAQKTFFQCC